MTTQTVTVTEDLTDMEYSPKCESILYVYYSKDQVKTTCDNPATQVLVFHTCKGCVTKTNLECDSCVEDCKQRKCPECGAEQYISSMPIKGDK